MIYEVTATLFFNTEDEAKDFYHDCEIALAKAIVVKPDQPDQQCSVIERIGCRHDLSPPEPCVLTEHEDNCPLAP